MNSRLAVILAISLLIVGGCQGNGSASDTNRTGTAPTYAPSPSAAPTGNSCPSLPGLEEVGDAKQEEILDAQAALIQARSARETSEVAWRALLDDSYWPTVRAELEATKRLAATQTHPASPTARAAEATAAPGTFAVRRAQESPYAELIANRCGQRTVDLSWWVESCQECGPAQRVHTFFVKRDGRWLVWWSYP